LNKPHEISSKEVLKDLSPDKLKLVSERKLSKVKAACGGTAVLGRRAAGFAKRALQPVIASAVASSSLGKLIGLFDDLFLSRMEKRPPGEYLEIDGHLVAFCSFGDDGKVLTREIFSPDITKDEETRIRRFIRERIPEAHISGDHESGASASPSDNGKVA
jgi:hypothetical protein